MGTSVLEGAVRSMARCFGGAGGDVDVVGDGGVDRDGDGCASAVGDEGLRVPIVTVLFGRVRR